MKKNMVRTLALIACVCGMPLIASAEITEPTYAGTVFEKLTDVALDGALFFGVIVAIAVLVTGFFLGRKWLRSV